jgi:hypothetical protein
VNGDKRLGACLQTVNNIRAAGGRASLLMLPEIGIAGNSHMMIV